MIASVVGATTAGILAIWPAIDHARLPGPPHFVGAVGSVGRQLGPPRSQAVVATPSFELDTRGCNGIADT